MFVVDKGHTLHGAEDVSDGVFTGSLKMEVVV